MKKVRRNGKDEEDGDWKKDEEDEYPLHIGSILDPPPYTCEHHLQIIYRISYFMLWKMYFLLEKAFFYCTAKTVVLSYLLNLFMKILIYLYNQVDNQ